MVLRAGWRRWSLSKPRRINQHWTIFSRRKFIETYSPKVIRRYYGAWKNEKVTRNPEEIHGETHLENHGRNVRHSTAP
jgi:hypothetical protein